MNKFGIEDILKLRDYESEFKAAYVKNRSAFPNAALSSEEFRVFFDRNNLKLNQTDPFDIFSKELSEKAYFDTSLDVSAIQHLRYMPAVLHGQEFFELDCVLKGEVTSFIGDQKTELKTGDVMILAPNTQHASLTYSDDGIMINILVRGSTFEDKFMNLLPDNDLFRNFFIAALYKETDTPHLLFHTNSSSFLIAHVLPILREYQRNNRYKNTMLTSLLSVFFVELLRNHEKDISIPSLSFTSGSENIVFILEYLQKNYATITLSHLAGFFNYSERQMQRIILKYTGLSFGDNVKKLRMLNAAELLKNTNMTIAEITSELGYYDSSNFRQAFKKYYSMSPNEYRTQNRG